MPTDDTSADADGPCDVCGQPGRVHHFPGASPTSGLWCDRHLARLRWLHPMGEYGRIVWGVGVVGALVLTRLWLLR